VKDYWGAHRLGSSRAIGALVPEEEIATNGGVLSTLNLVFRPGTGDLRLTRDTGKKVWSVKTGSAIESIPVTFSLKGGNTSSHCWMGFRLTLVPPARTMATADRNGGQRASTPLTRCEDAHFVSRKL